MEGRQDLIARFVLTQDLRTTLMHLQLGKLGGHLKRFIVHNLGHRKAQRS